MKDVYLLGDENFYSNSAISIAQYYYNDIDSSQFDSGFFSRGWFMPGMGIVLAPVAFLDLDAGNHQVYSRVWIVVVNLFLMWLIMLELQKRGSSKLPSWLFLLTFISPYALLYASAIWADFTACLFAIYLALKCSSVRKWTGSRSMLFGAGLAAMIYLRASYLYLMPIFFFFILFKGARCSDTSMRNMWYVSLSMLLCILLLLPWSIAVSEKAGINTLTTTLLKESQIIAFGDPAHRRQLVDEGESPNWWYAVDNAVRQRAHRGNISVGEQYTIEHKKSFERATIDQILPRVSDSIKYYLFEPSEFPEKFLTASCQQGGTLCHVGSRPEKHWIHFNAVINYLTISLLALFMLTPIKSIDNPFLGVFVKGLIFLYMINPLAAYGHPRYVVQFTPILALIFCLLTEHKCSLGDIIGFDKFSFYGVIGNAGQLLAAITVVVYLWLILLH